MSSVNISYEIGSGGGGEVTYYEGKSLNSKDKSHLANFIAEEIVNEIIENALDIATKASETGIPWKEIKESRTSISCRKSSISISQKESKYDNPKSDDIQMDNICSNIVGDIVEHIGIQSPPKISDIIEGLNSISEEQSMQNKKDKLPLDVEMKKLLVEMLSPPYEIVNYDVSPVKGGVGDQPYDETISETTHEPDVSRTIEKKSRVTDLVKNSPHIISEYLMVDKSAKQHQEELEESAEQLLQVIELEHVKPGEEAFRVQKKIYPENIALPDDDNEAELIICRDDILNVVDISSNAFREEERQLSNITENSNGAKGDEPKNDNMVIVMSPHETGENAGENKEVIPNCDEKNIEKVSIKQQKAKKKKWNFGTKLFGFLKKGSKTPDHGSSGST